MNFILKVILLTTHSLSLTYAIWLLVSTKYLLSKFIHKYDDIDRY